MYANDKLEERVRSLEGTIYILLQRVAALEKQLNGEALIKAKQEYDRYMVGMDVTNGNDRVG